jgi:hypothetical protein
LTWSYPRNPLPRALNAENLVFAGGVEIDWGFVRHVPAFAGSPRYLFWKRPRRPAVQPAGRLGVFITARTGTRFRMAVAYSIEDALRLEPWTYFQSVASPAFAGASPSFFYKG